MKRFINAALNRVGYHITNVRVTEADMHRDPAFSKIALRCRPYTMISVENMFAVYQAIRYLEKEGIRGDLLECGVWKGGTMMLMALTLQEFEIYDRNLVVFDLFDLPDRNGNTYWQSVPMAEVERNILGTGFPNERLAFHPGDVLQTLPAAPVPRLALLRLDTDLYDTTKHALEHLYPQVELGGIVIIDDYGSHPEGAGRATDEFLATLGNNNFLHRVHPGRLFIKRV